MKLAPAALAALAAAQLASGVHAGGADATRPTEGRRVFDYWCATCHGAGPQYPGTMALAAKYNGSKPALLEQRTDLTPQITEYFVRHGISVMPPFRKTEISDAELRALAAYLAPDQGRRRAGER